MADDEFPVESLVTAAIQGDETAWNDLVDRYSPLLVSVLRQCRLSTSEVEDVAQIVWLRLVENLERLRDAQALPKWIITTGRREAWRHAATGQRVQPRDPATVESTVIATDTEPDEELLRAERHNALLAGLAELGPRDRALLLMLIEDPPPSYAEISRRSGIAVGGIGPTRSRALDKLRRSAAIQSMMVDESECHGSTARTKG
jgi:RNA polymerase sigma factor (sigma-70 family)